MYQKVKAYINRHHMLGKEDKVIAGVSGGADSVCLLLMLIELQKEIGFSIVAVHIHHGLRGETADRDEQYVRILCQKEGIDLRVFREDVKKYADQYGLTEEEAGREVRRGRFREVLEDSGGTKIALAHHCNDNAETLLWNICRGTGLAGLGGIRPVQEVWIRPLLCLKRSEIESYLKKRGISYCTDETNLDNTYTRNKIRNHIIPYLEEEINSQAVSHMAETIEQMRLLGDYVSAETKRYQEMCTCTQKEEILLKKEEFMQVPEILRPYVLHEVICSAAGKRKDIEAAHVKLTEELLKRQVGRKCDLPYGVKACRNYEGILFSKEERVQAEEKPEFRFRIFEKSPEITTFPRKTYTKWFDYDIIKNTVKMRHRAPGDYITIDRNGGAQKLKQYFINEKIPQKERENIWLAADGQHIMWIVGYRQNQAYQITENTRTILEIEFCGGESNVRDSESDDFRR